MVFELFRICCFCIVLFCRSSELYSPEGKLSILWWGIPVGIHHEWEMWRIEIWAYKWIRRRTVDTGRLDMNFDKGNQNYNFEVKLNFFSLFYNNQVEAYGWNVISFLNLIQGTRSCKNTSFFWNSFFLTQSTVGNSWFLLVIKRIVNLFDLTGTGFTFYVLKI